MQRATRAQRAFDSWWNENLILRARVGSDHSASYVMAGWLCNFQRPRLPRMMYWTNLWLLPQAHDNWEELMWEFVIGMDVYSARNSGWPKNNLQFISKHFKKQNSQEKYNDFWYSSTLLQLLSYKEECIRILFGFWIRNIPTYKLFL